MDKITEIIPLGILNSQCTEYAYCPSCKKLILRKKDKDKCQSCGLKILWK